MNPGQQTGSDQGDLMATLLNAMFEAPAYQAPAAAAPAPEVASEPVPAVQTWITEPAPTPARREVGSAPDWDRIVPRIAAGTFTGLAVAEAAIVATNWRLFLHIIEGIGVALALLAALLVGRAVVALLSGESVTVTGRRLNVFRGR
jgi:hypothetical protein